MSHQCPECGSDNCDGPSEHSIKSNLDNNILQWGSDHYKQGIIQPIEFIKANNLTFPEGNVIKYITRHKFNSKEKGREDLLKAKHYIDIILLQEYDS